MIDREITDKVLLLGPAPDMKGGIAQVLDTYFNDIIDQPKFIAETVNGVQPLRIAASVAALFRLVWRLATDRRIRIVHLHTATKVSFPRSAMFAAIARLFGRRTVLHLHGANFDDYYRRHKARVGRALRKADRVVALSGTWRNFLEGEVGLGNVSVVPNIVPEPVRVPTEPDGRVHALFLGLIGDRKGIFDLLAALQREHAALRGRFVLHVGGNGEIDKFNKAVADAGLGDVVEFHGWVRGDDKVRLLNLCSLYVLPSYGEGLPISVLEAMTYGNAVISTPVGGIPEVVDDTNGALVAPGDVQALSAAIIRLVENPGLIVEMGAQSIMKVKPHLSESVEQEIKRLYESLM